MPTEYKGWPSLLYYHLIHSGKHDVGQVAQRMGVSASSLYKYAEGECNFPPDLIPTLYNATKEKDFLDFCVKGTDQMLAPRPQPGTSARSLEMETLDVASATGEMAGQVRALLEDGRTSEIEIKQLEKTLNGLQREVEEVRQKIRRQG